METPRLRTPIPPLPKAADPQIRSSPPWRGPTPQPADKRIIMAPDTTIPVLLSNGLIIQMHISARAGEEDVAFKPVPLRGLAVALQGIAEDIFSGLERARLDKTSVEFGVEVALEAGQLTALVMKGSGSASFKVTMEWSRALVTPDVRQ